MSKIKLFTPKVKDKHSIFEGYQAEKERITLYAFWSVVYLPVVGVKVCEGREGRVVFIFAKLIKIFQKLLFSLNHR